MPNNNDVVIIELDRKRELRFGHKALKKLSAMTGMSMEQMGSGEIDFGQMEAIIYCGLYADDKDLTLEQMEDLLDLAPNPKYYMDKMTEALSAAFGTNQEQPEGNDPAAAGK
ncbi:hypothetical protein HQN89_10910 [Paenibacillus frigoriresistens]|uniref:hypothetical protein n=1 Tax=Paenibacillus alginolyticus TaxID=59839 RepID=UPI001565FA9E|nr:hypothetical protein [Paenibacillus frigoriresistens]NRF91529.1 hypothetical protein [Paenibacillus frigoriresistens]